MTNVCQTLGSLKPNSNSGDAASGKEGITGKLTVSFDNSLRSLCLTNRLLV